MYIPFGDNIKKIREMYVALFDKRTAKKIKKGDIFHSWENANISLKKAKEAGMITLKETHMLNMGFSKLFPNIPEFSEYTDKKSLEKEKTKFKFNFAILQQCLRIGNDLRVLPVMC